MRYRTYVIMWMTQHVGNHVTKLTSIVVQKCCLFGMVRQNSGLKITGLCWRSCFPQRLPTLGRKNWGRDRCFLKGLKSACTETCTRSATIVLLILLQFCPAAARRSGNGFRVIWSNSTCTSSLWMSSRFLFRISSHDFYFCCVFGVFRPKDCKSEASATQPTEIWGSWSEDLWQIHSIDEDDRVKRRPLFRCFESKLLFLLCLRIFLHKERSKAVWYSFAEDLGSVFEGAHAMTKNF